MEKDKSKRGRFLRNIFLKLFRIYPQIIRNQYILQIIQNVPQITKNQYILKITQNVHIFSAEEDKKEEEHLHIRPVCCIQCVAAPPFTCVTEQKR